MRTHRPMLDRLALLLVYPGPDLCRQAHTLAADLKAATPTAATEVETFASESARRSTAAMQEEYTAKFDMNPASALDLGWHLFGDAPERGAFMAALRDDLERVAVRESRELPDHLTHILALLAREDEDRAVRLAHLIAPAIDNVRVALAGGKSPYAHVLAAVQTLVAAIGSACETEGARP